MGIIVIVVVLVIAILIVSYKRIKSNEALVIWGKGTGAQGFRIKKGGATFVIPFLQGSKALSLEPFSVDINLTEALTSKNIRVNIPSSFTLAISEDNEMLLKAARRILDLTPKALDEQVIDIILGQLRVVIAGMDIEEINADREKFEKSIENNVATELARLGIELINVNITDITDESGYIDAIGKKAASTVINQAQIDVAEQEKRGTIGRQTAEKETAVEQAKLKKEKEEKETQYQAELAEAQKDNKIRTAEAQKEVEVANANFIREQEIALATANIEIANKKKEEELAQKRATEVVQEEIRKEKQLIQAETEAQKIIKDAQARAESIRLEADAEAQRINKIMKEKAAGYDMLSEAVGKENLLSVLMVEKLEEVSKINAEALKNIKIDKVTVWDNGTANGKSGKNGVAGFIDNFAGSIPVMHDLAENAGIKLPEYLGKSAEEDIEDEKSLKLSKKDNDKSEKIDSDKVNTK